MATTTTSSTQGNATTAAVTTITTSWFKQHEIIVCLFLVLLFGGFGVEKYCDYEAVRADAKNAVLVQQVKADADAIAAQQITVSQMIAQFNAQQAADKTLIASLAASVAQRNAGLQNKTAVDANLPLAGIAARWNQLLPTVTPSVAGSTLSLTTDGAHATLNALEKEPVCEANLANETTLSNTQGNSLAEARSVIDAQSVEVAGLKKQNIDQAAQNKAEVAAVKAEGKKNSVKWFKRGLGIGFIAGLFAGHAGF